MPNTIKQIWFTPVFAALLRDRREGVVLLGAGALQVGLHLAGLPGWQCPFKAATGLPCPGCGLTAAVGELLHGHWQAAISVHAFAPVFLLAFIVLLVMTLLPAKPRQSAQTWITKLEQRTAFSAWVLLSMFLYWGLRLSVSA